jgi:excisionase family DNA binding protein
MSAPADDLYTIDEAAAALAIHRATVYRWIARGDLRTVHVGRLVYVIGVDVDTAVAVQRRAERAARARAARARARAK